MLIFLPIFLIQKLIIKIKKGFNDKRTFEPSVQVQADWQFIQHFDLKALTKLSFAAPEPEDLFVFSFSFSFSPKTMPPGDFLTQKIKNHSVAAGEVKPLDTKFLHLNPRNEKLLRNHEAAFFNKTASDDAIIKFLLSSFSLFFFFIAFNFAASFLKEYRCFW